MYIYTTNLPKYCPETSAEAQLILTHVSLFYKLHHPLPHGPIFNTICNNNALMFTLPTILSVARSVAKGV